MNRYWFLPPRVQLVWTASRAQRDAVGDRVPYDAEAKLADAPARFSATSYVVWCFAQFEVILEDDLLCLHQAGARIIGSDLDAADLVFRSGRRDRHARGQSLGIGHVGIYTGEGTVLHASPYLGCLTEDRIADFLNIEDGHFRGVRRIAFARA